MKLTKEIFLLTIIILITLAISCREDVKTSEDCGFDPRGICPSFSFSFVDPDTYENLMGVDGQPIHPDSIVITHTRKDTMNHEIFVSVDGWHSVYRFWVFEEISCFNQCLLDSAFTRTYYVYLGNDDTDTMEVYFPERSDHFTTFYNGLSGEFPEYGNVPEYISRYKSVFWFRKIF